MFADESYSVWMYHRVLAPHMFYSYEVEEKEKEGWHLRTSDINKSSNPIKEEPKKEEVQEEVPEARSYKCHLCDAIFDHPTKRRWHITKEHNDRAISTDVLDSPNSD